MLKVQTAVEAVGSAAIEAYAEWDGFSLADAQAVIAAADYDGDGVVDYAEFIYALSEAIAEDEDDDDEY